MPSIVVKYLNPDLANSHASSKFLAVAAAKNLLEDKVTKQPILIKQIY